jgi:AraC-like DNA-binding protein
MAGAESRTESQHFERFARTVLKGAASFEQLSPSEHGMRWDVAGNAGSSRVARLRSGIELSSTQLRWERPWTSQFPSAISPLKFNLARGASPRMVPPDAPSYELHGCQVHVRHATNALNTTCEFRETGAKSEQLALEVAPDRLRELLGSQVLPLTLENMLSGTAGASVHEQPISAGLSRVFDEVVYCDARGASRQLLLEAKGLELLALLIDELELTSQALSPLRPHDIERLERARRLLLEHMAAPPGLRDLARHVGLNEVKLKFGFRTLFGSSVFAYLRAQRLDAARRLLLQRNLSVTEIAVRVGYQNPSKFAAAFKKQFGLTPSALR